MERKKIKQLALKMIRESGLINLTRGKLCLRVGIPEGSFAHIMGCTFTEFFDELKAEAGDSVKVHAVNNTRADPELRKDQLMCAAVVVAKRVGYNKMTRNDIAVKAQVSLALVTKYFGTMPKLRRAVMRAAIKRDIPEIIAQGLANGDIYAKKAPPELKEKAVELIAGL